MHSMSESCWPLIKACVGGRRSSIGRTLMTASTRFYGPEIGPLARSLALLIFFVIPQRIRWGHQSAERELAMYVIVGPDTWCTRIGTSSETHLSSTVSLTLGGVRERESVTMQPAVAGGERAEACIFSHSPSPSPLCSPP